MLREEPSPVPTCAGYRVRAFRQRAANLAERTLRARVIRFVPWLGVAGVFLPRAGAHPDAAALRAAWEAQGAPPPCPPGPGQTVLLGQTLAVRTLPYAGADDLWEEPGALVCACRRAPDPAHVAQRVAAHAHARLQALAEAQAAALAPRLAAAPARIVVRRLGRRTLGQCRRDGEIRLSPALAAWWPEVVEETLAHELTHLSHFNHSPAFWRALSALLPDWLPRALLHHLG